MNDNQLAEKIAEIWIENGGDRDGFFWCVNKIAMAIEEKEREKNETSSHSI